MANAPTVVSNATSATPRVGNVLDGLKFFVVQRVPRRTGLLRDIEANGGQVVRFEGQCDYVIADHLRKDAPGGSYSYTLIDRAIKDGALPNPADHATGGTLRSDRPVGSVIPGKHTRTPFTLQDDRDLWEFIEEAKQDGASVKGNDVYKKLEKVNPRHTFQAWRSRYITKLLGKPHPPGVRAPADDEDGSPSATQQTAPVEASAKDLEVLRENAEDIEDVPKDDWQHAWGLFHQVHPHHTAEEWISLYTTRVRPFLPTRNDEPAVARYDGTDEHDDTVYNGLKHRNARTEPGPYCTRDNDVIRPASPTKRKRTSHASSPIACSASHKKQKADAVDDTDVTDQEIVLTSDLNRDAERQVHFEANAEPDSDSVIKALLSDTLPTSEANTAADRQLFADAAAAGSDDDEECDGDGVEASGTRAGEEAFQLNNKTRTASKARTNLGDESLGHEEHSARDLLTSEANKDADEQLREIMQDDDSEVQSQIDAEDSELVLDADNTAVQHASATSQSSARSQHALTEANLASQQAEHRQYIPRATDLPPDEEEKDQSDFIDYLQTALSKTKTPPGDGGTPRPLPKLNGLQFDHVPPNFWQTLTQSKLTGGRGALTAASSQRKPPENIYIAQLHRQQQGAKSVPQLHTLTDKVATKEAKQEIPEVVTEPELEHDLPMSSQQELEEALNNNLEWPASPQQQQHRSQQSSQSQPFGTQIAYPSLGASTSEHTGFAAPDFQLSSQSMMSQLDEHEDDTHIAPKLSSQRQHVSSEPTKESSEQVETPMPYGSTQGNEENNEEESQDAAEDNDDTLHQDLYRADGDVDLTIVEPDGGFIHPGDPEHNPMAEPENAVNAGLGPTNEPIMISSAASSSSPYQASSDGEEPDEWKDRSPSVQKQALETQDIMNAQTHIPDLSMPEPSLQEDDSDEDEHDELRPQAPVARAAPAARRNRRNDEEDLETDDSSVDIDAWILSMKALGFIDKAISTALKCTTYRPHLAQAVLYEEKRGHGLPDDTPGIWSKLEDEILEGGDARKLRQLAEKHGSAECDGRLDFLSQWREMFPGKS
ncbi:hypothetical protein CLAFUW4_00711 [Fulvia fulva]|uniref:Telomeric repeat-binding factor 2-interacting protein 1 n=1 Tax=Passalora fulva TaxID=5499 RepID=A0A9Q8L8P8_PASFU|nr:uncharacterized protein CLAFUR5_00714 [Fulvia fulva]KAK4634589.1 hypothetical protein CLAFUR4_00712 [Fulvia fulva]KAK4638445.1 hypothetical protein CLAFUR0_00713 [Fulvia fulva]UJO12774.1 hypothetical protein CLAFUR5_00714 [Fulvia fulva]WPV08935.1 hypothetical protein CLAFUW4_00711 [Fulvia fulva]WPV25185.1 hypothetical protein CLAFUW7_00716 [Fulvia fulva]